MKRELRRITTLILGWILILLGVVGLFLPVLQGLLFIALGVYVLSRESTKAKKLYHSFVDRYPNLRDRIERLKVKFQGRRKSDQEFT